MLNTIPGMSQFYKSGTTIALMITIDYQNRT